MPDWREMPNFTGRHVQLRALEESDLPGLLAMFAQNAAVFTTLIPDAATIGVWFDKATTEKAAGRAFVYVALDAAGEISGTTRYLRISPAHKRLEIGGTVYAPRVQRTGFNTEAKFLLLSHAFETLGCNVVQLRTDWLNARSRAAIQRLGAKQDGVLRAHMIMPDGHVRDTVVYSILAAEWPGVKQNLLALMARGEGGKDDAP